MKLGKLPHVPSHNCFALTLTHILEEKFTKRGANCLHTLPDRLTGYFKLGENWRKHLMKDTSS